MSDLPGACFSFEVGPFMALRSVVTIETLEHPVEIEYIEIASQIELEVGILNKQNPLFKPYPDPLVRREVPGGTYFPGVDELDLARRMYQCWIGSRPDTFVGRLSPPLGELAAPSTGILLKAGRPIPRSLRRIPKGCLLYIASTTVGATIAGSAHGTDDIEALA